MYIITWLLLVLFYFIDSSCMETVKKQTRNAPIIYQGLDRHNESGYVLTYQKSYLNSIYINIYNGKQSFLKIIL